MCSTPGLQKIRQNFSVHPINDTDESFDFDNSFGELLKQTWNIWGVTSLFGFQQDNEVVLKRYAKKLREEVASMLPYEDVTYESQFDILDDITPRPSTSDLPPVKIVIIATGKENKQKNIYTGVMISWRTDVPELDHENSSKLPLILCKGTKSGMNAVHTVLANMFDCQIAELPATEEDLKWLVPIILNPSDGDNDPEKGEVRFEYRVPGLPATDTVTTKFQISDLVKLWKAVSGNNEDEDSEECKNVQVDHVERFFAVLHKQMLEVAGLQLGLCSLKKISLPSFTIMDNRMKTSSPDILGKVLLFFNQKSLEILHYLNFSAANSSVASR